MKKALIFQGKLVEIAAESFPVSPEMQWIDVADDITVETHTYNGVAVVLIPPKPLAEVKANKLQQLEAARDRAATLNVTAHNRQWQADERSQRLLNSAITLSATGAGLPLVWRDVENNNMPITVIGELVDIAGAIAAQTQEAYLRSWVLKTDLAAATTVEAVELIVW